MAITRPRKRWVVWTQGTFGTISVMLGTLQLCLVLAKGFRAGGGFEGLLAPLGLLALGAGMLQRMSQSILLRVALAGGGAIAALVLAHLAGR